MRAPTAAELAAIAAAYLVLRRRDAQPRRADVSRWALAGRLEHLDVTRARLAARAPSRWNVASRLDG